MAWVNFKELREKLDVREVLRHYGVVINAGNRVQHHGPCPLPNHGSKKRDTSFSFHLDRGIWKCFGCGAQGNILDFCCLMEKLDPGRADDVRKTAVILAERYRIVSEKPPAASPRKAPVQAGMPTVINAPLDFSLKNLNSDHPYLLGRGFTTETIAKFELGFCSRGLMKDRIAIPLRNSEGKLIGYAGRVVDDAGVTEDNPKYRFPSMREHAGKRYEFDKSKFVYNGNAIAVPTNELVIVQGFPAVWWLTQHGFGTVVGLMGATCSAEQAGWIVGAVPRDGKIWILPNGDQAGRHCAESLLKQLAPVRMIRWPELKDGRKPQHLTAAELRERLG